MKNLSGYSLMTVSFHAHFSKTSVIGTRGDIRYSYLIVSFDLESRNCQNRPNQLQPRQQESRWHPSQQNVGWYPSQDRANLETGCGGIELRPIHGEVFLHTRNICVTQIFWRQDVSLTFSKISETYLLGPAIW